MLVINYRFSFQGAKSIPHSFENKTIQHNKKGTNFQKTIPRAYLKEIIYKQNSISPNLMSNVREIVESFWLSAGGLLFFRGFKSYIGHQGYVLQQQDADVERRFFFSKPKCSALYLPRSINFVKCKFIFYPHFCDEASQRKKTDLEKSALREK